MNHVTWVMLAVLGCSGRYFAGGQEDADALGPIVTDAGSPSVDASWPEPEPAPVPAFAAEYIALSFGWWGTQHVLVDEARTVRTPGPVNQDLCSGTLDEDEYRTLWTALVAADLFHQPANYERMDKCPIPEGYGSLAARVGGKRHVVHLDPCDVGVPQAVLDLPEAILAASDRATSCGVPPCIATGCFGEICAPAPRESDCEWLDDYGCYGAAFCETQPDDRCGFTAGPHLETCLDGR